jgi:hypothetical protein
MDVVGESHAVYYASDNSTRKIGCRGGLFQILDNPPSAHLCYRLDTHSLLSPQHRRKSSSEGDFRSWIRSKNVRKRYVRGKEIRISSVLIR